jgi:hypothetical protein
VFNRMIWGSETKSSARIREARRTANIGTTEECLCHMEILRRTVAGTSKHSIRFQSCKNRKQDRSAQGSMHLGDACFCLIHVSFSFFQLQV